MAGSVPINIVTNTSQALIETGASVNAHGGDVSLTSLNNSTDTTLAFPGPGGQGDTVGIGASLALNIVTNDTRAEIQDGAALTNAGNVTVTPSRPRRSTPGRRTGRRAAWPSAAASPS